MKQLVAAPVPQGGIAKNIPHERVQQRTDEQGVDVPVPRVVEKTFGIAEITPQTRRAAGSQPTAGSCCEDITGKCIGNTNTGQNVGCGTGYKQKTDYSTIMETTEDNCCDQKTCADLTCASHNKQAKSNPAEPATGAEPSVGACCEDITGKCTGNTNTGRNVWCGTGC